MTSNLEVSKLEKYVTQIYNEKGTSLKIPKK